MHNILITGGAGFIGSNLIRHLQENAPEVMLFNLDALTHAGSKQNLADLPFPSRHRLIHGNICNSRLVYKALRSHRIDTIIHCAAETHVDRSIAAPKNFIRTNIIGTYILLEAARRCWTEDQRADLPQRRFLHISTDEVFGSLLPGDPPFSEASPYSPNSPYAASKAAADCLARSYGRTYRMPVTITRSSNNYGPRQYPEKLIPLAILLALEGKTIPVYGDGCNIRDWLSVEDHCRAITLAVQRAPVGETYNIGGGNQWKNIDLLKKVCALLDALCPDAPRRPHESLIAFTTDRPGHDLRYALNTQKIRRTLGWKPVENMETYLEKTVRWYLDHREWLHAIYGERGFRNWLRRNYRMERGTA
jgi:dTDP-glucose 4,6-dehydratase